jgi:hypothetical protein
MGDLYPSFMDFRFAPRSMSLRDRFRPVPEVPRTEDNEANAALALAKRRGRMTAAPAPRAGKAVAALLRPLMRGGGMGLNELKRRWGDIAGESFSRATPEKLAGGVLTLSAPGALAPFLQQQAPLLIERLKTAGANVASVRIAQRTASLPRPENVRPLKAPLAQAEEAALAQALDPVADPSLKSALMRLGRAVKQG